jgi:AcrR family transcriptional regulator
MAKPRDENKIEIIFDAALKAVLREGYTGLKMNDVAREAELATGTVYIYFKNKQDLINGLLIHLKSAKTSQVMLAYSDKDSFPVQFKKIWFAYLKASLEQPERTLFIEQFQNSSYLTAKTKKLADQLLLPVYQILEEGIKQRFITSLPSELLIAQITGPVIELTKLSVYGKIKISKTIANRFYNMAWNSVRI